MGKSTIYELGGKLFRYDFDNGVVRDVYLHGWAQDLEAESSRLAADFVKYELPYMV